MSDQSRQVEADDGDAPLRDLYRLYSGWLAARLRARFGDEADDLVQEAYVRVTPYSRLGAIRHPKALLMSIVNNLAVDRRRRHQPNSLRPGDERTSAMDVEAASQAEAVLLRQLVLGMPEELRTVFVLSRFVHLPYSEISERLGIPVTTVQWRMRQALDYCTNQLRH